MGAKTSAAILMAINLLAAATLYSRLQMWWHQRKSQGGTVYHGDIYHLGTVEYRHQMSSMQNMFISQEKTHFKDPSDAQVDIGNACAKISQESSQQLLQ